MPFNCLLVDDWLLVKAWRETGGPMGTVRQDLGCIVMLSRLWALN